ncbi:MAG: hypothetical protein ABI193_25240 [Minicystis sp.]
MRSRPDVELRTPGFVHPGNSLLVDLLVRSGSLTPIDFIEIELQGLQFLRATTGSAHQSTQFLLQTARVAEEGKLGVGEHRYQAVFSVPDNAFPSYIGQLFQYRYFLKLHVSIPWWPDVVERYDAVVLLPPATRRAPTPFAGTNVKDTAPFVEVSLIDQYFAPGEVIEGALAFGNLGGRGARQVALSLLGYERFLPYAANEAYRFTAFKTLEEVPEGEEVSFRFAVPKDAIPSFGTGQLPSLFWAFEVQIEPERGPSISHAAPITIARFDRPAETGALRRRVGNGRWHAVWDEAGRGMGLELDPTELSLHGAFAGCAVSVKIGADDDGKRALVGELRWDAWGLGLSIRNRGVLDFGLDLEDEAFSRRFRVRGRDEAQTRAALTRPLLAALGLFDEIYLDDQRAVLRSRTPGHDQPWIGQFLHQLLGVGQALQAAALDIPAPPALTAHRRAYARFAEELGARIEPGSLSLRGGQLDGARVEIETDFARGEAPRGTVIRLEIDPPLAKPWNPASPEALTAASPLTRSLLKELLLAGRALAVPKGAADADAEPPVPRIEERSLAFTTGVPLDDPARARTALGTMIALAESLRGEKRIGPYR